MSIRNSTYNIFQVACSTRIKAIPRLQWFVSFVLFFLYGPLAFANGPDVIKASRHDVSPPLSQMAIGASSNGGGSESQRPTARATGALQLAPAAIHTLWTGFGGLCEFGGGTPTFADGGDPVVLYDHLAERWLVTQLQYNTSFTQTAQCVAVSTSSDARGSYNRYEYDFGANFPDYPKFSVWPDAYYNTINVFPGKNLPVRKPARSTATPCSPERPQAPSASSSLPR